MKQKYKNFAILGGITFFVIVVIVGSMFMLVPQSFVPQDQTGNTTVTIYSYTDGEDVSDLIDIEVYSPDPDTFEEEEDYTWDNYAKLTNWEKEDTGEAEDISLDITGFRKILVRVDPDNESIFQPYDVFITGGSNTNIMLYAYHLTSDVNFNILNRNTMAAISVGTFQTDGNFSLVSDVPHETHSDLHYGSDWDISTDDYADMDDEERQEVWDEANWRCQPILYNIEDDDDHDFTDDWERTTETFGYKFAFNTTLNSTDGSVEQVNMTLSEDAPFTKVQSGQYIYVLAEETIDWKYGENSWNFEITFAANVSLSNVYSGRFSVPKEIDDPLTFAPVYSSIAS